jgi:quercetin dioxygenase-like cupin family protein
MSPILSHEAEIAQRDHAVEVIDELAVRLGGHILCSKDPEALSCREAMVDLIPAEFDGVTREFIPIAPPMPTGGVGRFSAYTSIFEPGARIDNQALSGTTFALHVVIDGALSYDGWTLTSGDWVWVPAGHAYSLAALDSGAGVFTALPCVDADGGHLVLDELLFRGIDSVAPLVTPRAEGDFVTSRDGAIEDALERLAKDGVLPGPTPGVTHLPLPFAPPMPRAALPVLDGRFFAWLARIEPGTVIPRHTHPLEQIADIKVVLSGSIHCGDRDLVAGDWLWAPSGGSYTFKVGAEGALLLSGWPWN